MYYTPVETFNLIGVPLVFSEAKSHSSNVTVTPKLQAKKVLQKPIKTVAQKVTNEVTDIGFLYKNPELVKGML